MATPPAPEAGALRLRTGTFAAGNLVLAVLGVLASLFVLVVAIGVVATTRGSDRAWGVVGTAFDVGFLLVMVLLLAASAGALRPVLVRPGSDGWRTGELSVPQFSLRSGFTRRTVALGDVRTVELTWRSEPRNSRWQLVVRTRDGVLACDSITSTTSEAKVRHSRAYADVQRLRECVVAAQT